MKILFSLLVSTSLLATPVNTRDAKMNMVIKDVELPGLLENENFRVVKGTGSETVDLLVLSQEEALKAATVFYHLNRARRYFVDVQKSDYVKNLPQVLARIEMDKPFNEFEHFLEDSKMLQANNAVSIPASSKRKLKDKTPWNMEIWFRPARDESTDNPVYQIGKGIGDVKATGIFAKNMGDEALQDAVMMSSMGFDVQAEDYSSYLVSIGMAVGFFELVPRLLKATKGVKSKRFLDTAMIPEVSYHEFTHVALSDFVELRRSGPVNEGLANYFAAVISGHSKIAAKNGKHSKNYSPWEGKKLSRYRTQNETVAHSNFVFAFLWHLRSRLAKEYEHGELLSDRLIFEARKYLTFRNEKPIKNDLLPALTKAVEDVFPQAGSRKARMIVTEEAIQAGI